MQTKYHYYQSIVINVLSIKHHNEIADSSFPILAALLVHQNSIRIGSRRAACISAMKNVDCLSGWRKRLLYSE